MRYKFLRFPEGKEKALTLSYDDGCKQDEKLISILNQYGIKTTLNINSELMGKNPDDWRLSAQKILELAKSGGHEIALHGAKHVALGNASTVDGIRDVLVCRESLEKEFDMIIRGLAYADTGITRLTSGVSLSEIEHYLKAVGIAYGRTLGSDNCEFNIPEDFYAWMPTVRHANPLLFEYLEKFLNARMPDWIAVQTPLLFYMWGHSYEFDQDNNWDRLEEFCQRAGGHSQIWYATNIEICDYVMAYRALQFSVDNTKVYNPTCRTVWFAADGVLVCVPPGETIGF